MTKGSAWKIGKGCFGGSMPGKMKTYDSKYRGFSLKASMLDKGTVGRKLSKRIL